MERPQGKTMSDDIKINSIPNNNNYQQYQRQPDQLNDRPDSSVTTDKANISNQLSKAVENVSNQPITDNSEQVQKIKQDYQNGNYVIDHLKLADDLLNEYLPEDGSHGQHR